MLNILDLTHRLPGPYATKRLLHLGFKVTRIEDLHHPDPFINQELEKINPQFKNWHEELNENKNILPLDLSQESDLFQFHQILKTHKIVINSRGEHFLHQLGIDEDFCKNHQLIIINLRASKIEPHLHDLNALAQSGLLNYHLIHFTDKKFNGYFPPPFLPIAGITFGHTIAEKALSSFIKKDYGIKHLFLDEEIQNSLEHLKHHEPLALHNGKFPSYGIYQLNSANNFIAIALIEEKFWLQFITHTGLPLSISDRFSTEQKIFDTLIEFFSKHNSTSLKSLFPKPMSCLSFFNI